MTMKNQHHQRCGRIMRPSTMAGLLLFLILVILQLSLDKTSVHAFVVQKQTSSFNSIRPSVATIQQQQQQRQHPLSLYRPLHTNGMKLYDTTNDPNHHHYDSSESIQPTTTTTTQPTPVLVKALSEITTKHASTNKLLVPQTIVTFVTAASILLSTMIQPLPADAAMSGGRIGGSFSRSGGGGGSSRMMMPSRSSSSYYGGGYYPRSTTIISPTIVSPFYNPFYSPIVPFYGGGVGAISYGRGPGLLDVLFLGGIGLFVFSALSNAVTANTASLWNTDIDSTSVTGTSVVKLSMAFNVPNRYDPNSLLNVLDRMANTASSNTQSRKSIQTLTSQVALELLRRKSSMDSISGTYEYYISKNYNTAQKKYNQWSIQERSKFEQETNYNAMIQQERNSSMSSSKSNTAATMAVVTLVLCIQGELLDDDHKQQGGGILSSSKIPKSIQTRSDMELVLRQIASLQNTNTNNDDILLGAEILWTPEDPNEILTKQDIIADYPELHAI